MNPAPLDLSQVTPEQFLAAAPHLDHQKIEQVLVEIQNITAQNIEAAQKWTLIGQAFKTVGLVLSIA